MSVDYGNKIKGSFAPTRLVMDLILHAATSTQGHIRVPASHIKFTFFFKVSFLPFQQYKALFSFLPVILSNRFAFSFEKSVSVLLIILGHVTKKKHISLRGKFPYLEFFWSVFSLILIEYSEILYFFSNLTLN